MYASEKRSCYTCNALIYRKQVVTSQCKPIGPPLKDPPPFGICVMSVAGKCVVTSQISKELFEINVCNQTPDQTFTLPGDGTIRKLGQCLDVKYYGALYLLLRTDCNGSAQQQWNFLANGQVMNPSSNRCLDVVLFSDLVDCKKFGTFVK